MLMSRSIKIAGTTQNFGQLAGSSVTAPLHASLYLSAKLSRQRLSQHAPYAVFAQWVLSTIQPGFAAVQ